MRNVPRPIGVMILVITYVILAILRFGAILMLMLSEGTGGPLLLFCLAPNLILGIIYLFIAMGLYSLNGWAWTLALVFAIISIIYAVLNIYGITYAIDLVGEVDVSSIFLVVPFIALVLNVIVILVLLRNKDLFD
jgi:hypothetical protein